nr:DUF3093 domain-containing protein [Actinopolyspora mortivallis]
MSESSEAGLVGDTSPAPRGEPGRPRYRERVRAAWWSWPLPLVAAVLLAAEVHMGYPGIRAWLPYVVLVPLAVGLVLWMSRLRILVTDEEFVVGSARLPLRVIADVEVIPRERKQRALGPELDPAAFLVHRPWAPTMVRIWLDDPEDPTPYWVVSTRRPEQLARALTSE